MPTDQDQAIDRLFTLVVVLGGLMNRRLAEHGLTPARAELLWLLHGHGQLTQRQLSDLLDCTPRNVTGLVDALQAAGLITRTPHPADRRATLVTLTKAGTRVVNTWRQDRDHNTAAILATTPKADLAAFIRVADNILTGLQAAE